MLPLALVANLRLAGKERLKAFPLQTFEDGDGRDVGITVRARFMFVTPEYAGNMTHQFFVGQRPVTAYLVYTAKAAG